MLRRFTATPYTAKLQLMQRTVRLETNDEALIELALGFFACYQHGDVASAEFVWRIVCESDSQVMNAAVQLCAFSDTDVRYVSLGQRGFMAVDLEARQAIAFFSDVFLQQDARMKHRPPLDILFSMSCASLGLLAFSGACVGTEDRGVLIFGPPNSGKTTASYIAAKRGLQFHADQVVFLDTRSKGLRVWGDPFPAVFRPETLKFLPELEQCSRQSTYADLLFHYFDKSGMQARWARPLQPVASLFLDRSSSCETALREIDRKETISWLRQNLLFEENSQFDSQLSAAIPALADKPVYRLRYDRDPAIAADFIERMLR